MTPSNRRLAASIAAILLLGALAAARSVAADAKPASKEVTGQHRGFTNDQLFLRLDDDKEMTFVVRIPGDTDRKWHDQFATLSRVTVTYHDEAGEKYPVATAIRQAPAKKP